MSAEDVLSSSSGLFGSLRLVAAPILFSQASVKLDDLAVGDVVLKTWAEVTVAFDAGTTNVLTLGDGTTGNKYLAAADVAEGSVGVTPVGGAGPFKAETVAGALTASYAQTGTAAAHGAAAVYALIASKPR